MKKTKLISFVLTFLLLTSSCSNLGTSSLEPSDEEINAEAEKAYNEVKAKSKISTNKNWNAMVQRVANRIAMASKENFKWETIIIESPEINAWCMPGGKMAVYTGIMPILKNEAALAAVMGHEVSHATLRHGKKGYARAVGQNIIGAIVGTATAAGGQLLCKTQTCKNLTSLAGVATGFAMTFFDRKFSRKDETSADKEGQLLMAKAGYDPSEAPVLWDRMKNSHEGAGPPEFLSTHPSEENRKEALNSWMSEAKKVYQSAPHQYGLGEKI